MKTLGDITHKVPTQCVLKRTLFGPDGKIKPQVIIERVGLRLDGDCIEMGWQFNG